MEAFALRCWGRGTLRLEWNLSTLSILTERRYLNVHSVQLRQCVLLGNEQLQLEGCIMVMKILISKLSCNAGSCYSHRGYHPYHRALSLCAEEPIAGRSVQSASSLNELTPPDAE